MKIKRIVFFTLTGIGVAVLCYLAVCAAVKPQQFDGSHWKERDLYMTYFWNFSSIVLCTTCQLAVIDFLVCYEEKNYNKSMFGIAITLFALFVVFMATSVVFGVEIFPKRHEFRDYIGYFLWEILTTTPILGLAIAYGAVKFKFYKSTAGQKLSK